MTDGEIEELNRKIEKKCLVCDGENVSVRIARKGWYFVGCLDCENKTLCDESKVVKVVDSWNTRVRRVQK